MRDPAATGVELTLTIINIAKSRSKKEWFMFTNSEWRTDGIPEWAKIRDRPMDSKELRWPAKVRLLGAFTATWRSNAIP
jgi:hypothetical protein